MPDATPSRAKSEKRQRTAHTTIRLLPEERAELEKRAVEAGFSSLSDYVRVRCLNRRPLRPRLDLQLLVKVETALNRIGANVNQIAAVANKSRKVKPEQLARVQAALEAAHAQVDALFPQR
jgi:alanine racemase